MKWLILLLGILCNASASALIKVAITPPRKFPSLDAPLAAIMNWPMWVGLFCYGSAFLLYAAALTRLPLNVVHPVMTSGAIATVAVLSVTVFRESFHWTIGLGIVLIIGGMFAITAKVDKPMPIDQTTTRAQSEIATPRH